MLHNHIFAIIVLYISNEQFFKKTEKKPENNHNNLIHTQSHIATLISPSILIQYCFPISNQISVTSH